MVESIDICQWSVVSGRWSVVRGRWSVVGGRWSVVGGRWSVVGERCRPVARVFHAVRCFCDQCAVFIFKRHQGAPTFLIPMFPHSRFSLLTASACCGLGGAPVVGGRHARPPLVLDRHPGLRRVRCAHAAPPRAVASWPFRPAHLCPHHFAICSLQFSIESPHVLRCHPSLIAISSSLRSPASSAPPPAFIACLPLVYFGIAWRNSVYCRLLGCNLIARSKASRASSNRA